MVKGGYAIPFFQLSVLIRLPKGLENNYLNDVHTDTYLGIEFLSYDNQLENIFKGKRGGKKNKKFEDRNMQGGPVFLKWQEFYI
jgi:hypothetical protein